MKKFCFISVWGVATLISPASAGDLNPPAGAVTGTMKTLVDVEPRLIVNATNTPADANSIYRITVPGSYYLTGNIAGANAKNGIKIATSGVTLDLNGFELLGVVGSLDGVTVTGAQRNIAVVNGSMRNWGADGVDLGTNVGARLSNLRVSGNSGRGLNAANSAVVTDCSAYLNTGAGIEGGLNGVLADCAARQNGGDGVLVGNGWVINRTSSHQNTGDGLSTGTSANVSQFTATDNSGVGIDGGTGSTISGCSTRGNVAHGIRVSTACGVSGNSCYSDGGGVAGAGAGIFVSGLDNRIEGNNCASSGRGIHVNSFGNLIIRNSATLNGINYEIVTDNKVGAIVAAPNSLAISGSTGGAGVGTMDPWSNLSY